MCPVESRMWGSSIRSILDAQIPMSFPDAITRTRCSSHRSSTFVSLLRSAMYCTPSSRARVMARLFAPEKPTLSGSPRMSTRGKRSRTNSTEPSVEPLSTRMTSKFGYVCLSRAVRQSSRKRFPFQLTTMTIACPLPGIFFILIMPPNTYVSCLPVSSARSNLSCATCSETSPTMKTTTDMVISMADVGP